MLFHRLLIRLRHRRRFQEQSINRTLAVLALWVLAVCAAHVLAMMRLEGMGPGDALWLTATTIVTVGYGDLSARTGAGRAATILLMYGGGIFVVANLVGALTEYRSTSNERKATGAWDWKMNDHLVLIGEPTGDRVQHIARLVQQVRDHDEWADTGVLVLTRCFDGQRLPPDLADLGIVHVSGTPANAEAMTRAGIERARAVLVFAASATDSEADSRVLDIVMRVRERNPSVAIVAECVDKADHARLRRHGADRVIRVMHGYPEVAARALNSPGAEQLIEALFTSEGEECRRIDLPRPWTGTWTDLLVTIAGAAIGTPIGYRCATSGQILASPVGQTITADTVFVIVADGQESTARTRIAEVLFAGG